MPNSPNHSHVIRFGVFEVDLRTGELRKSGVKIRLQEQPFQVLAALLERRGELVTRPGWHVRRVRSQPERGSQQGEAGAG